MSSAKNKSVVQKQRAWWQRPVWHMVVLVVLTFWVYGRSLTFGHTLDDAIVITQNELTQKGFGGVADILGHDSFYGFFKMEGKDKLVAGGRYRPLSIVLFAMVKGLTGGPAWVYHLLNILLYCLLVLVVYRFLRYILEQLFKSGKEASAVAAWIGALLFAWHPLHVEVVANVKGADEVLALLLTLLTAGYVLFDWRGKRQRVNYFISALLTFLAMMSKENAIVMLVWIPIILWLEKQTLKAILRRSLGVLSGVSAYLALRFAVLGGLTSGGTSNELMNNPFLKVVDGRYVPYTLVEWISSIFYTFWEYLRLMVFPHPLSYDYYPRSIPITGWGDIHVMMGMLSFLVLFVAVVYGLLRRKKWSIIPVLYLFPLVIVSNLLFPIGTHMGERFAFFSTLAWSVVVSLGWVWFGRAHRGLTAGLIGLMLLGFGMKSWTRLPVWKDDFTLFTHDVSHAPNSAKARNAAAGALVDKALQINDEEVQQDYYRQAIEHEKVALRIHPNYAGAHYIKGLALLGVKSYDEAISSLNRALDLSHDKKEFEEALYLTLLEAGKYKGEKGGDPAAALRYFIQAKKIRQSDPELFRLMGVAEGVLKHYPGAIRYFKAALRLKPGDKELYKNISISYHFMGKEDSSAIYMKMAQ